MDHFIRAWTHQLYREYDNLLFTSRLKLRPPVIQIVDLRGAWGKWDPETRTLSIHTGLIERYSWDIVVEILKHEVAHQWVSENDPLSVAHGESFKEACRRLGVAPWAMKASGEIENPVYRKPDPKEERFFSKVQKLLALAGSDNPNEALSAMNRVQELYAKYNLDERREEKEGEMVCLVMNRKRRRLGRAESTIYSILSEHFKVKVIYNRLFDARDLCEYRVAELFGRREDVLMGEYVHGFLLQKLEALWRSHRGRSVAGASRISKNSFQLGVLRGFSDRLEETRVTKERECVGSRSSTAIAVKGEAILDAFVAFRHPRLAKISWGASRRDFRSFEEGQGHGRRLTVSRPLADSAHGFSGLLSR